MWQLTAGAILLASVLGFFGGKRWEEGAQALALEAQKAQYEKTLHDQKVTADKEGMSHAETIDTLNLQLRNVDKKLAASTTGRACLSARAVGLLNAINVPRADVGASAAQPANAPEAAASDPLFATDRDIADAIAVCRTEYTKLADQLNSILDIEDQRTSGK